MAQPTRREVVRQIISDETWRELLTPDGTAAASKFQRNFVRATVARATGKRPSLMHLTLGQGARVLECVGQSPAKLTAGGRGVPGLEKAGAIAQWTLFGVLVLMVTVSSPAGFLLAAGIVGLMFLLRKRRRNRQAWEDATWVASPVSAVQRIAGPAVQIEAPANYAEPQSVAVETDEPVSPVTRPYASVQGLYQVSLGRSEWPNVEVVGEHAYGKAIKAALRAGKRPGAVRSDSEVEGLQVELVAEPDNPYDPNAISVRWRNHVLGYLSREDALRYAQPVRRIIASGLTAATTARIWAYDDGDRLQARVTLALPEPGLIAPLNEAPTGVATLVPWGSAIQVLKEENHFDILFNHVPPDGVGLLLVSLHKAIHTLRNGTERLFVEVRLNGERVGELSNVTSAHLLPLLEHTETVGETAIAYARITGSALAAQLVLHAAKATEISNDWLSDGPHPAPKLLPWATEYEVPPAYAT
ncbi:HIRAN domain-containing protein [Arthrobacter sp. CJ23]|uniref:HIRAN domain-containing protein n=1 Tax=Arthrobacter sp. CJ23 TaxID=2972479 RepID=UPI00215BC378|nr:HIRAN domain-containing protein [Arthrobacter sp. CJ23]UVJ41171.1 HIRAN domain-containing protein [Arthrobacter sp. CJ23]